MKRSFVAGALAGLVALSTVSLAPQAAEAGWRRANQGYGYAPRAYGPRYGYYNRGYYRGGGWNPGAALAVGAITGLAIGAIASSAPRSYYYAPAPAYYPPPPVYQPYCFWQYYSNGARQWICT